MALFSSGRLVSLVSTVLLSPSDLYAVQRKSVVFGILSMNETSRPDNQFRHIPHLRFRHIPDSHLTGILRTSGSLRIHQPGFDCIHTLLGYCYIKNGLFRITVIKRNKWRIKSGELRVWEGTDGVGTCYCSLGRSPFVRALLPLSFPDRPVPVSPILIKDFCLQGTGIDNLYMNYGMKYIRPNLNSCTFCRNLYEPVIKH